jgi:Tfp pilus assembly protein PilO
MVIRKRLIAISAILGLLTLAIGGGVGIPSVLSIRGLIAKISEEQGKIDARYALRRYIRNSAANLAETKVQLGVLSSFSLQEGKELAFVTAIEDAAQSTGVEHKLILETANQKELSLWEKEIPVKMQVHGDFPKILAFMNAVERLPYAVMVDGVQVASPRSTTPDREGIVDATVTGTVYWIAQTAPDFTRGQADEVPVPSDVQD